MTVDVPSWLGRCCWLSIFAMILQNVLPFGVQKGLIQLILFCFCFLGDWHVRTNGLVLCSMTYIACRNLWDNVFVAGYSADCTRTVPIPGPSWVLWTIYRFSKWNHGGVPNHRGWTMGQGLAKLDEGGLESMLNPTWKLVASKPK